MKWPSWGLIAGRARLPGSAGRRSKLFPRPRRSLVMTAALAAVLCGLGAFTLWGTLQATGATETQSRALVLDSIFSEARAAVAVEEMNARHHHLEPSFATNARYMDSAYAADEALRHAVELSTGPASEEAVRLQAEQSWCCITCMRCR